MLFRSGKKKTTLNLGRVVILVKDYDEALKFYQDVLDCHIIFDQTTTEGRFLHIGFGKKDSAGIWLLKAEGEVQMKLIGNQTGGQPAMVIYTDGFEDTYGKLQRRKVEIIRKPEQNSDFRYTQFADLYGNKIVLVELNE